LEAVFLAGDKKAIEEANPKIVINLESLIDIVQPFPTNRNEKQISKRFMQIFSDFG
jgi:hypothetical protein